MILSNSEKKRKKDHSFWSIPSVYFYAYIIWVRYCYGMLDKKYTKDESISHFAQQFECKIIFAVKFNATNKRVN